MLDFGRNSFAMVGKSVFKFINLNSKWLADYILSEQLWLFGVFKLLNFKQVQCILDVSTVDLKLVLATAIVLFEYFSSLILKQSFALAEIA